MNTMEQITPNPSKLPILYLQQNAQDASLKGVPQNRLRACSRNNTRIELRIRALQQIRPLLNDHEINTLKLDGVSRNLAPAKKESITSMIRVQDFEVILNRSRRVSRDLMADELCFGCIRWSSLVQKIRYAGLLHRGKAI
jgi:hypothetical protein